MVHFRQPERQLTTVLFAFESPCLESGDHAWGSVLEDANDLYCLTLTVSTVSCLEFLINLSSLIGGFRTQSLSGLENFESIGTPLPFLPTP